VDKGWVLVTGGAGYIGSHTCVELIESGRKVVVVDNLSNSSEDVLERIRKICGKRPDFVKIDVRNYHALRGVFEQKKIDSVLHFAALKAVGESVREPIRYYRNNINSAMTLCQVMEEFSVKKLIFSSSATVYGTAASMPINETAPLAPTNPYGRAKQMVEEILHDIAESDNSWRICSLRYFNPVGAHESGLIGEHPVGTPNNLMPYVCQVAVGRRKELPVYGADYPTADGTGVRDYIHVVDLAKGHIAALDRLEDFRGMIALNLGTGRGHSVLDIVRTFEQVNGVKVPLHMTDRRPGDVALSFADPGLARRLLGWSAERSLAQMCADAWRWTKQANVSPTRRRRTTGASPGRPARRDA
jgi:UDP-glucose 4-epimerase